MALQQCVRFLTVMIILLSQGHESQSFECGRIPTNQTGSQRIWPWKVFIDTRSNFRGEGTLITNQWVLTLGGAIQNYAPRDISLFLDSVQQLSSPNVYLPLENLTCAFGLCLLKLVSPVTFTDQIQPICLASENSTFYPRTESWITILSPTATEENELEIIGHNECQCYNGPLPEDTICAGFENRASRCLGSLGGPLMNKNDSVWVQSGVLRSHDGCSVPTKAGEYVRVSKYENWIRETVTGTPPTFVTFTSPFNDIDMYFTCMTDPTAEPTDEPTAEPTTEPTAEPTTHRKFPHCNSLFCGGESLIHFTHFTALCVLVVSLHAFVGSGGI